MKTNKFVITKLFCIPAISLSGTFLVVSCNKGNDAVSFDSKYYYCQKAEQIIPVKTNSQTKSIIAEIVDCDSNKIYLKEKSIEVVDNIANISICVNNSYLSKPIEAKFSLNITTINKNGSISTQKYTDFVVQFESQIEEQLDPITCKKRIIDLTGTYCAKIPLLFDVEPKSEIYITLIEPKNTLILRTDYIKLVKDPDPSHFGWLGTVIIDLPLSLYLSDIFNFSLKLSFINSYGKTQITVLDNLIINYFKSHDKVIPDEYYDIQNNVLLGFKDDYSKQRIINECDTIKIPDGVTEIKSSAFNADNTRSMYSINRIIFPKSVTTIEKDAFTGCVNLFEIDISAYDSTIVPEWIAKDQNIFAKAKLLRPVGYIWTSKYDYDDSSFIEHFEKIGLTNDWLAMRYDMVTPEDLFEIQTTTNELTGDEEKVIKSVKKKYLDYLWYFTIIKIPNDVTKISSWAFMQNFGDKVCLKHGLSSNPQTRRLVFDPNNKLELIESFAFSNCGIGGPLYIPIMNKPNSTNSVISEFSFENLGYYNNSHSAPYVKEPVRILFENKHIATTLPTSFVSFSKNVDNKIAEIVLPPVLENIPDYAFDTSNCPNNLVLPNSVKTIGNFAFENNTFSDELVLTPNLKSIGQRAFSYHKFTTLRFKAWNYVNDPENPGTLMISQLESVGDQAFGSVVDEQHGWISGYKTLKLIDLSMYPIASPDKSKATVVEVPKWLSDNENGDIFTWGCDTTGGKVLFSSTMLKSENKAIFDKFKELLIKNGVPSNWTFTDVE